jgi:HEAT repeat protein
MKMLWSSIVKQVNDKDERLREKAAESLGQINTEESVKILKELLNDDKYNVRCAAINSLCNLHSIDSLPELLNCLSDKNELVRVNAIECIGQLKNKSAVKTLINILNDKSNLVRSYAGSALGAIGDSSAKVAIENRLLKENNDLAKVGLYEGLYLLGSNSYLKKMFKLFDSSDYHVRCSVANILGDIVNSSNKITIIDILNKYLNEETTVAVKSSITNSISKINSININ